jgi:hypothetical protein
VKPFLMYDLGIVEMKMIRIRVRDIQKDHHPAKGIDSYSGRSWQDASQQLRFYGVYKGNT